MSGQSEKNPGSRTPLILGVLLFLAGIALYSYAISGPPSGVAMDGLLWGSLALLGLILAGLGLLIFGTPILIRLIRTLR